MTEDRSSRALLTDLKPGRESFLEEVMLGLEKKPKELPCKYLYDERGARLFELICSMPDYYIPRAEKEIMQSRMDRISECLGIHAVLVEYGCGDCVKTRALLDGMASPAAFVPIDISREQLERVSGELRSEYPQLNLLPVCADYTEDFELPFVKETSSRVVVYFPGSTIGNFHPPEAVDFMSGIADVCGPGGALLIGVDLKKDPRILHRAYNDREGLTAAFNLNILRRINRELGADFSLDLFDHYALYNPRECRVEMHLLSLADQEVSIQGETVSFRECETIWTESSYKYSPEEFGELAAMAGFRVEKFWTDQAELFSVQYLVR